MISTVRSLNELPELASYFLSLPSESRIYLLEGQMGAGKTTLVSYFLKALYSSDPVQSPSFGLVHEYRSPGGPIYHFDFYRIGKDEEALDLGLDEYFDSGYYCFVEWPEKIERLLPEKFNRIHIALGVGDSRKIELIPAD